MKRGIRCCGQVWWTICKESNITSDENIKHSIHRVMHSLVIFELGLSCFSFQSSINSILCSLIGHVLRRVVFLLSLFLDVT